MSGNTATVEQILKDFFAGNYCEMAIIGNCEATIVMFDVTLLMLYVMAIGFSVLRVYAISHGNKSIALATFIFGVITVPLNIYLYSAESYAYVFYLAGMPTCDQTPNFSNTLYFQ
ncbi:hypothetical protein POSPLADRAFT_1050515 [Postia placenta MAD-698-R-SB12]|uniref:Uncharacterized protein n=1 Tax=Postia placenta MAD-698-R-SB12 TaxID=670580 RepID=A0A1X6MJS4_9APHY|nr:hypothetical protein POSPLADRAFT_1050515 [Postia placenta MAD-698-R-SB12]OSX56595.1 hypothetical protein POSPLADRAFT_1050515 [Postia placenta MAD-698-R-SB12]